MREGYGKLEYENGDILQGVLSNNEFVGYCEFIKSNRSVIMKGEYEINKFLDYVIVQTDSKYFEGEVISNNNNNNKTISIGRLYSVKKPSRVFYGEVSNYKEECGYGIFLLKNSVIYYGHMKNKTFHNYIEMYNAEGGSFFGFLKNGIKEGLSFSFSKDMRVCFGKYIDDLKNGPFVHFSNSHSLPKSSVRMEIYHLGFKSKIVDKMETSKKYLSLYYPEFCSIFNVNYSQIIEKYNVIIPEELDYYHLLNTIETANDEKQ